VNYVRPEVTGTPLDRRYAGPLQPADPREAEVVGHLLKSMETPAGVPAQRLELRRGALVPAARKAPSGLAPWQIRKVREHVEQALSGVVRVSGLAEIARLSTSHFTRAFKASFGTAPGTYVSSRRIERAKALMLETRGSLCQISLDCGFTDQAHLSRVFRRFAGETPSRWRRENRAESLT